MHMRELHAWTHDGPCCPSLISEFGEKTRFVNILDGFSNNRESDSIELCSIFIELGEIWLHLDIQAEGRRVVECGDGGVLRLVQSRIRVMDAGC